MLHHPQTKRRTTGHEMDKKVNMLREVWEESSSQINTHQMTQKNKHHDGQRGKSWTEQKISSRIFGI